jgi:hypothetical protein
MPYFYSKETKNIQHCCFTYMSLDNIQLPEVVVAGLYKKTLVQIKSAQHTVDVPINKVIDSTTVVVQEKATNAGVSMKYLGKNQKGIVIVVQEASVIYLTDAQMDFLIKVIAACQLSLDDCAVVNLAHQPADYLTLETQLNASVVLMLGVSPQQVNLPLAFPAYQVQAYRNARYVHSEPVNVLMASIEEKRKFWGTLKMVFNLA